MKILCIGQSAYDITLPMMGYPTENKKIKINEKVECGGGSANNCAYLLGLWKSDVYLVSGVGKDLEGKKIKEELLSVNVNLDYFYEVDKKTITSYIIANKEKGTRTIITYKNDSMNYPDNYEIKENFDIILMDGHHADLAIKVIKQNKDAIKIIDAGSLNQDTVKLCYYVDYILCSNDFAKEYTKINFSYDDEKTLKKVYDILEHEFRHQVVITLEERGCFTKIENEYITIPSIKVKSIDSTGAGDIFHGAFTYFIANNYPFDKALRLANIAGALSVEKVGSKASIPHLDEVLKYD